MNSLAERQIAELQAWAVAAEAQITGLKGLLAEGKCEQQTAEESVRQEKATECAQLAELSAIKAVVEERRRETKAVQRRLKQQLTTQRLQQARKSISTTQEVLLRNICTADSLGVTEHVKAIRKRTVELIQSHQTHVDELEQHIASVEQHIGPFEQLVAFLEQAPPALVLPPRPAKRARSSP